MKNADMPATPTPKGLLDELTHQCVTESLGLTKREHFAGLAMQGILSNSGLVGRMDDGAIEWVAKSAFRAADALLAELEK